MGGANDKFDTSGTVVGVGDALNTDVTYQQLVDSQKTTVERGVLEGYLTRHNRNMNSIAGRTTGVVNVEVDAHVPIFAWGITHQWTAAVVIPVVTVKTHVDTGFVTHPDFQKVATKLVAEGKGFKAKEVKNKTNTSIPNKNNDYGYEPIPSSLSHREETSLGDIRLINKVQLLKEDNYALTLQNDWILPTGQTTNVNRLVDIPTGDGQLDFNMGVIGEYYLNSRTTFWTRLGYTWQTSDKVTRRIPENLDSSISADIDKQVYRNLGDSLYTSIGGSFDVYQGIKLKAQYSFQYKEKDKYEGDQYEASRYSFLSKDSLQELHVLQVGMNYSTIPLFQNKQFPVPLDFNLISGIPLSGRNVTKDPSVVAEVAIYF